MLCGSVEGSAVFTCQQVSKRTSKETFHYQMRREEEVRERDILLVKTAETLLIHFAFRFIMLSIKNRFKETTTSKLTVLPSVAYPCLSKKMLCNNSG